MISELAKGLFRFKTHFAPPIPKPSTLGLHELRVGPKVDFFSDANPPPTLCHLKNRERKGETAYDLAAFYFS